MQAVPVQKRRPVTAPLHRIHRTAALVVLAYAVPHLLNHLIAVNGPASHIAFMDLLRQVYRQPVVEAILLLSCLTQIVTGAIIAWQSRNVPARGFARIQRWAGLVLGYFLVQHLSAVFYTRLVQQLDTNFYFAASVVQGIPLALYFAPYYWVGVAALFVHIACALRRILSPRLGRAGADRVAVGIMGAGAVIGIVIVVILAGGLYPIHLPPGY